MVLWVKIMIDDKTYSELTYKEQLDYTQNIKQRVLEDVIRTGPENSMPTDPDSINSMLKIMDSMDRTTLSDRKNKIDSEGNASAKDILDAMSMFIKQTKNANPFAVSEGESEITPPDLEAVELGEFEHAPGEAEQGNEVEDYASFDERMEKVRAEELKAQAEKLGID